MSICHKYVHILFVKTVLSFVNPLLWKVKCMKVYIYIASVQVLVDDERTTSEESSQNTFKLSHHLEKR